MPLFKLTAPDGRKVTVEGAEPPTEADADQIFAAVPKQQPPALSEMEGLFAGVDGIDKFLGPAAAGELNASLINSADPKAGKVRAANVAMLSSRYGVDAGTVAANLPLYRQNFSRDVLGVDEPTDDNAFYTKVGAHITTEKAQGQMLGQMSGALFNAVRKGEPFNQTYEAFRGMNLENAGYVKGRDEYYREFARQQWAFFRTNAIRLSEPIERVSAHMSSLKGGSAYFADENTRAEREQIITMLAAMPEQDREMVLDFASGAASAQSEEQEQQGFGSKAVGKARRGVGALAQGVSDFTERTTAGVADALEPADGFDIGQMKRPTGGFDFLARSQSTGGSLEASGLGPEEARVADRQKIERAITQRITGEVDPMRAGGWLSQGILDAAESMPRMLVSLSGTGLALNLAATKQEITGRYEDQGLSAADADTLGGIAAVPYVALDFVSAKMAFKGKLPGFEKFLTAPVRSAGGLAGRAAAVGGIETAEQFTQEVAQDLTAPVIQSIAAALSESIPDVNWSKELDGLQNAAPETLAAVLPFVLIGTGSATFKDRAYGREYFQNLDALRAVGFSEEVATEIMDAPTPEQAGAVMRQSWGERQPSSEFIRKLNERAIQQREEMGQLLTDSQKALLAKYPNELGAMSHNEIPVEIRQKDGTVIPAVMNGYQETFGKFYNEDAEFVLKPSVGYYKPEAGGLSHTSIRPGDEIITDVPTPEQWRSGMRSTELIEQPQLEQVQQQPAAESVAQEQESLPAQPEPTVSKVPETGYVVTDKNSGQVLGSAPTAEGAAQIVQDVKADGEELIALNKAAIKDLREGFGMEELPAPGRKSMATSLANAKAQGIDQRAEQLAAVLQAKPRTISDEEHAGLVLREAQLENQLQRTEKEAVKAFSEGNDAKGEELIEATKQIEAKIEQISRAADLVGTEAGRALNIRKMQLRKDYTLARMVIRRELANNGKLTAEQRAETEAMHKKIADLERQLADYQGQLAENQKSKRKPREKAPPKPREPGKVMAFLSEQATAARARLKERLKTANSGIDPTAIADLAIVGAEYIAKGVRDFSKWSAAMIKEFGDRLTPHLAEIFDQSKVIKKLQDIENRLTNRITELERQIRDEAPFAPEQSTLTSPEIEAKRAKIAELTERRDNIRDMLQSREDQEKRHQQTPEEKRVAQLEREIAKVEKQLADQAPFTPTPEQPVQTEKTRELEAKLGALREERQNLRDQLQPKPEPEIREPMTDAEKEASRLDREIERIEQQLSDRAPFSPERKESEKAPENEGKRRLLEVLRQKRENLRDEIQNVEKLTPEQRRLQAFKTRAEKAIADIEERLAKNDFSEKPELSELELDDRARQLQARLDIAKLDYQRALESDKYKKLSKLGKAGRAVVNTWDSARNLITTGELSFILRQGLPVVLSHPILAAKAIPDTLRTLASSKELAHAINLRVTEHPDAAKARAAKLHLVSLDDSLNKQEESQIGRWSDDIPVLRNFNAAANVFLNRIRFDAWQAIRPKDSNAQLDREIANYVNIATGRGSLPGFERSAVTLGRLLFAPRFLASRFQLALGIPLWRASNAARLRLAGEYARASVGMAVYYGLLYLGASALAGDDEEKQPQIGTDPRSADFGKIRIGENRLDPLAGLSQAIVFMSRGANAAFSDDDDDVVTSTGRERAMTGADLARFARSKAHPVLGAALNLAAGEDLGGEEATVLNQTANLLSPITYRDIFEAYEREDIPDATAMSLMMLLGVGLQNYERKEPAERTVNP